MKKELKDYLEKIDNCINNKKITKETLEDHLIRIKLFQHERLIHLIVTVFVGLISVLFLLFGLLLNNLTLFLLFSLTFILFIPYILHYYFLENGVQKLYYQYWQLKKLFK